MNIKDKYKEIKNDITNNIDEVFDRAIYYCHKYRGDLNNDINVGFIDEGDNNTTVQIFLRNNEGYIKELIRVKDGKYTSEIETNLKINEGKK